MGERTDVIRTCDRCGVSRTLSNVATSVYPDSALRLLGDAERDEWSTWRLVSIVKADNRSAAKGYSLLCSKCEDALLTWLRGEG